MQAERTAPSGLKITAWLWIAAGALMGFSGAMAAFLYFLMGQIPPPPDGMPGSLKLLVRLLRHFDALIVLQLAVAGLAVFAGMALLQLKRWARIVLESLSWLGLAVLLGFCVLWIDNWLEMAALGTTSQAYNLLAIGMTAFVTLAFAVPLVIMIRYLRCEEAHLATAPVAAPPPAPPAADDEP